MTSGLVCAVAYARIATRQTNSCADFATRILGLQTSDSEEFSSHLGGTIGLPDHGDGAGDRKFRTDARYQSIIFADERRSATCVGIELVDGRALDTLASRLDEAGHRLRRATSAECTNLAVRAALITHDPSGNAIEFVVGPRLSGERFFPSRDSGVIGLRGVGLRSIDVERDLRFWTDVVGARVRDRIGDAAFLAIDDYHHRIAIHPSDRAGLLSVAIEIESVDGIMQNSYFLADRQVRILQGPGRNAASHEVFLHADAPGGTIFSLVADMSRGDAVGPRPRQFAPSRSAFCTWGSVCTDIPEFASPRDTRTQGIRP